MNKTHVNNGKINNVPDMPALRQPEITSTDRERGPKVPTILVIAGKKFCKYVNEIAISFRKLRS